MKKLLNIIKILTLPRHSPGRQPCSILLLSINTFCVQPAIQEYGLRAANVIRVMECSGTNLIQQVRREYIHMAERGFEPDLSQGNSIIKAHIKFGLLEDARQVFDKIPKRDKFSWAMMMAAYAKGLNGGEAMQLFSQMLWTDSKPDRFIFVGVLKACASLGRGGEQIHGHIIRVGFESDLSVGNAIIDMYLKRGRMKDARQVFDEMHNRNDFTWTSMITGYVQQGNGEEALKVFSLMNWTDLKPNPFILSSVLKACADMSALEWGKGIQVTSIKIGFEANLFVGNCLATMYVKCGRIEDAKQVFDEMCERDVVSWTALIVGFAQCSHEEESLQLFGQMLQADIKPNELTCATVLSTCGNLGALEQGKQLQAHMIRNGLVSFLSAGNALTAMYTKCGCIKDANQVFNEMSLKDVVSWTTMITAYVDEGQDDEALKLAFQIQRSGEEFNEFTFATVLSACANIAVLEKGKQLHALVIKAGFELNISVKSALISMYSKCGKLEDARHVFDSVSKGDVVTWTAIIAGHAMHGNGIEALQLFERMQREGLKPDFITFIGVLSACGNAGLVEEGWCHFKSMIKDHGIEPTVEHYGCMVDLLGRAGHLDEAEDFIKKIPWKPDAILWGSLLAACKVHGKLDLGKRAAEHLLQLEPQCVGTRVLLANMYAADGRWADAANVRQVMKDKGLKKQPGRAWIEVKNRLHTFIADELMIDHIHKQGRSILC